MGIFEWLDRNPEMVSSCCLLFLILLWIIKGIDMKSHIEFVRNYEKGSDADAVYDVVNKKGEELGDIGFNDKWKTWIFNADIGAYFDVKCLQKVIDFLKELNNN